MFKKPLYVLLALLFLAVPSAAQAHTLWVNIYESFAHPPGHAIASIAYGHALPMDDLLSGISLESYYLADPNLQKTDLPLPPPPGKAAPLKSKSGMNIMGGDMGTQKFILTPDAVPGTYQVAVTSKDNFFSKYVNQKGKTRWGMKPMDQIEDARKLISGMLYKAVAKSYFAVKQWSEPKPLGFDLEIMPATDLRNIHVGDKVDFKITFRGKPLTTSPEQSIEYITATSNTFGGPDKFGLSAVIFGGKGSFRMPTAGQWMVNVYTRQEVTADNDLKHLAKKCTTVLYSSTICFNVKP